MMKKPRHWWMGSFFINCRPRTILFLFAIFLVLTAAPSSLADTAGEVAAQEKGNSAKSSSAEADAAKPSVAADDFSMEEDKVPIWDTSGSTPVLSQRCDQFYARLDTLNRNILLKDIELERFNTNFRQANNVQGRWRGPRYFLSQEGQAGCTMAGTLATVIIKEKPIRDPFYFAFKLTSTKSPKGKTVSEISIVENRRSPFRIGLEEAIIPRFTGQCLGALGASVELGINLFHDHQACTNGFATRTALGHVEGIKNSIRDLFVERDRLLAEISGKIPDSHLQLAKGQGVVLQDLCNLALNEYIKFHIGARRFRAFQDLLYLSNIAKNVSGAADNIVSMYANHKSRSTATGPAGVLTGISAACIMGGPIFSRLTGKCIGMYTEHKLKNLVEPNETTDLEKLQTDRARLAQLMRQTQPSDPAPDVFFTKTVELDSLNELSTQSHRKKLALATREVRAGTRAASENVLIGIMYGATKLELGTSQMIGGFHYWKNSIQSNIQVCDGNIAYLCGGSLKIVDNVRIQLRNELERRKLTKDRLLPGQILDDHLKKLDEIEHQLVSGNNSKGLQ